MTDRGDERQPGRSDVDDPGRSDADAPGRSDADTPGRSDADAPGRPDAPGLELLVVGPAGYDTGGIAQYIANQRRHLADRFDVEVYDVGTPRGGRYDVGRLGMASKLLRSVVDLLRFPFRGRPDVVHVHVAEALAFFRAVPYVLFAALVWRRPVVVHLHAAEFEAFIATESSAVALCQRVAFSASDAVVCLADDWTEAVRDRAPGVNPVVVPNAVDPGVYRPQHGTDPPRILFLADLVERKGFPEFVEAIARLRDRGVPEHRVDIAGTGPLADRARRLERTRSNVEFHGYVDEDTKRRLLDRASVYVLPSRAEGMPISVLEAMAGGNALVTTPVGALPEIVGDEHAITVAPGDADALADALATALADGDRIDEMGRTNRALVANRYSWERVSDRLSELYLGLQRGVADGERGQGPNR